MDNAIVPQQTSFLESILDPRVRRFRNEQGLYISALDVLEIHGKVANPTNAWGKLLSRMIKRQGFVLEDGDIIKVQFSGMGGKLTPMIREELFYRVVMRAPIPEWEPLRCLIADLMNRHSMGIDSDPITAQQLREVVQAIKGAPKLVIRKNGYVYLFQDQDGICKIGLTTDLDQRWASLEREHGPLELLAVIRTTDRFQLERELHQKYAHRHHHLEWFALSDGDVEEIKQLALKPGGTR